MTTWPAIRGPLVSPKIAPVASVIRTDLDAGPSRQRMRFASAIWVYSAQFLFTDAEFSTFLTYWSTSLHKGADWFTLPLSGPTGDFSATARFVGGTFQATPIDGGTRVNASIEVDREIPQ